MNCRLQLKYYLLAALIGCLNLNAKEFNKNANMLLGKQIYSEGKYANGKYLTGFVSGDVPVSGKNLSCENCHRKSGMGSSEGQYVVPPIGAGFLFSKDVRAPKPVYTSESFFNALTTGVDPQGNSLSELMPRYEINRSDAKKLETYIKTLSNNRPKGVSEQNIQLATIITDDVNPELADSYVRIIETYAIEKNRQTRIESKRPQRGKRPEIQLPSLYRNWDLRVWKLTGAPSTWEMQLEAYNKEFPVFAIVGGISESNWNPINRFCESQKIPCLYPSVNRPGRSPHDWYSFYYSEGIQLDAKLIASDLIDKKISTVVQFYCDSSQAGGLESIEDEIQYELNVSAIQLRCNSDELVKSFNKVIENRNPEAVVLWMSSEQVRLVERLRYRGNVYLSSALLGRDIDGVFSGSGQVAYGYRLPNKMDVAFARFKVWARLRKIELKFPFKQAEAFFAALSLNDALVHIRRHRLQDYLVETIEHADSMNLYLPGYPSPSAGPGQRVLVKGGYLVPLIDGKANFEKAIWIQP